MKKRGGFSLIELMMVVVVIAVLASIALPSFFSYILKARRADAQQMLLDMANEQALWRSSNISYSSFTGVGGDLEMPVIPHYNTPVVTDPPVATAYTLSITAAGNQANDKERGTTCSPLTYVVNGTTINKTPAICWER